MEAPVEKKIQHLLEELDGGGYRNDLLQLQQKPLAEILKGAKDAATPEAHLLACEATRYNIARSHLAMHAALTAFPFKSLFDAFLKVPHLEQQRTLEMAREAGFECAIDAEALQPIKLREFHELRVQSGSPQAWREYLDWEQDLFMKIGLYQRLLWESENSRVALPRNELWLEGIELIWRMDEDDKALLWAVTAPSCDEINACRRLLNAPRLEKPAGKLDATAFLCVLVDEVLENEDFEDIDWFFEQIRIALGKNPEPLWMRRVLEVAQMVDRDRADKMWKKEGEYIAEYIVWLRYNSEKFFKTVAALQQPEALEEKKWVFLMLGRRFKVLQVILEQHKLAAQPKEPQEEPEQRSREAYSIIARGPREVVETVAYRSIATTGDTHVIELSSEPEKEQALALLRYRNLEAWDAANTTVWVTNFAPGQDLEALGAEYGRVVAVRKPHTGGRFAYIQYEHAEEALAMVQRVPAPVVAKISDPKNRQARSGAVDEGRQLHVSGFLFSSDATTIEAWVRRNSVYSPVSVVVPEGRGEQKNQGYAFVEFEEPEAAQEALEHFNSLNYCGRDVRASVSRRKRRHPNPHTLTVSNVKDGAALQRLVDGDVKVEGDTATIVFETAQDAARASLQLAGACIGGATVKVEQMLKPRRQR